MLLKSLTLQGFKSFAGRTTLELPRGIAAVVGPNGSGKSNIADAIRWVLGEQSLRLLRGTKLEDVIFAGSETKRPVGMAEVSLTFDNSEGRIPIEYSEVTVSRRVYRSGESEFFINRTPCRLKDIQELFLDTGLGKGSLAIIGQGEVEAILSARPEERRAFLEEAAGVSKYRVKKREALVKLAQTQENLVRVGDIIREVESRLEPLAKQAEAAQEFLELDRQLQAVELELFARELHRVDQETGELDRALAEREERREQALAAMRRLEERAGELAKELDALDEAIARLRGLWEEAESRRLEAEHRAALAKERLLRADRDEAELRQRLAALKDRAARLASQSQEAAEALEKASEERASIAALLDEIEGTLADADARLSEKEEAIHQARQELSATTERLILLQSRAEALRRESSREREMVEEYRARLRELSQARASELESLAQIEKRLQEVEAKVKECREHMAGLQREAAEARAQRHRLERAHTEARARVQDLTARRNALSEMEAQREGYHRGVRAVLLAAEKRGWGLRGAIAQLIKVSRELETAIEVALGGAAQYIVADTDADAKAAIMYLKESRAGRATFLPLNLLSPNPLPQEAKRRLSEVAGAVGVASELVEVEEASRPAIEYLLGRVVVARDLDAALAVSKGVRGVSRVVTLDGDLVVPQGAMTGGSRPARSEGLIGRSRQLEELEQAIALEKERAAGMARELAALEEKAERLRKAEQELEEERRRLDFERHAAERDLSEAKRNLERIEREISLAQRALERFETGERARQEELEAVAGEQAALLEKKELVAARLRELEGELLAGRGEHDGLRRRREELRLALASVTQRFEERHRERERLARELSELERAAAEEQERLARLDGERENSRRAIQQAQGDAESARREGQAARDGLQEADERRKALKSEGDELAAQLKGIQGQQAELEREYTRLRVQRERLQIAREQILERLKERGVENLAHRPQTGWEGVDPKRLKEEAHNLRRKIDAIGPVNLASVEEYQEVKERYAFLCEQRDDLLEAKRQLDAVIARLDKESTEKLRDVFAQLRAAFAAVFARLFGGGRADLEFTDPSDPLESGIEIFVQPPGKRLQNLMALSGGEKALAAIALLFALLEVKPSPLCVLDEIDAALDEHNLERFRALLADYAQKTQFIVITHRQVTMEGADSLFGVTMEESGVSTLVSLRLSGARSAS